MNHDELNAMIEDVLDRKGRCVVSIDGRCASGKSTLSEILKKEWQAEVIHMDDFFLRPEQRTPERYAAPGENVDHERFLEEVLKPLSEGKEFSYHPFDPSVMALSNEIRTIRPAKVTVVEGSYSQRDDLRSYYDINAVIQIDPVLQKERLEKRNPERLPMFIEKWIPLEEMYFKTFGIYEKADIILQAK